MRLIDADALMEGLVRERTVCPDCSEVAVCTGDGCSTQAVIRAIISAPTIDAAPIVSCKNCVLRGDAGKCPMCYEIEHTWDDDGWDETTWETVDRTQDDGFCHVGKEEHHEPED